MNTLAKNTGLTQHKTQANTLFISREFWEKAEQSRFAIIPALLIIIACLGGVAAAFGAGDSTFQLALTSFPTIISLAFVLGVAPMKAIVYLSVAAVILDTLVLIF